MYVDALAPWLRAIYNICVCNVYALGINVPSTSIDSTPLRLYSFFVHVDIPSSFISIANPRP